jgi:hypothetical protein
VELGSGISTARRGRLVRGRSEGSDGDDAARQKGKNGVAAECSPANSRCGLRRTARRHLELGTAWGSGLTYPGVRDREGLREGIAAWKGRSKTEVAADAEFRDNDGVFLQLFILV